MFQLDCKYWFQLVLKYIRCLEALGLSICVSTWDAPRPSYAVAVVAAVFGDTVVGGVVGQLGRRRPGARRGPERSPLLGEV